MLSNIVEAVGYALVLAFLYLVWAPLAILGAGLLLVVWANVRSTAKGGKLAAGVGAALGAAWKAWKSQRGEG